MAWKNVPGKFKGTADLAPGPLHWFRDEDGIEWAGPHEKGGDCPWGFCADMDFREYQLVVSPNGDQGLELIQPVRGHGFDEARPFCHTIDGDRADWQDFVVGKTFIKEI